MNNFTISGNLAKDPWVADSGKAMRITVAVSKGYKADKAKEEKAKGNQTADFFDVMVFSEAYIAWLKDAIKKGDGVICACKVHNKEPREVVNKECIPEIHHEHLIVLQQIEITNRRSAAAPHSVAEEVDAGYAEEEEEDPIQATSTIPSQPKYTQQKFNTDEW